MIFSTYVRPKELDQLEVVHEEINNRCTWSIIRTYVTTGKLFVEIKGKSDIKPIYMVVNNWEEKDHGHVLRSFMIPARIHHIDCIVHTFRKLGRI